MAKNKIKDSGGRLTPISDKLQKGPSRPLTLEELNAIPKEVFRNGYKTYRESTTFDEHLETRYGRPGSETRKRFEARAQAFMASEMPESAAITVDPEILGGTPVFTGTRVPIQNLLDHLKTKESIESFLAEFDGVTKLQIQRVVRKVLLFQH